jgi:hypothetical protein
VIPIHRVVRSGKLLIFITIAARACITEPDRMPTHNVVSAV